MGVICVGVPWGGGALVSIPSKSISPEAQAGRAVVHEKNHEDACVRSLGHRAIEWLVEAEKEMRCRFAEFRAHCSSESFFANHFLAKMTSTPHLYRTKLSGAFSILETAYRQGHVNPYHIEYAVSQIKDYVEKTEKITRYVAKSDGKYVLGKKGRSIETKEFSARAVSIYTDMVKILTSKYTRKNIRESQPSR